MRILPRFPAAAVSRTLSPVGAWLSLVEHSVRDRGVGGSNPLAPTNFPNKIAKIQSTRALGFTRVTS